MFKLLIEDPEKRPDAKEALQHRWFDDLREGLNKSLEINRAINNNNKTIFA